jgi:hypothetical protein
MKYAVRAMMNRLSMGRIPKLDFYADYDVPLRNGYALVAGKGGYSNRAFGPTNSNGRDLKIK